MVAEKCYGSGQLADEGQELSLGIDLLCPVCEAWVWALGGVELPTHLNTRGDE